MFGMYVCMLLYIVLCFVIYNFIFGIYVIYINYVFLFLCLYILTLNRRHCATSRKFAVLIPDCVIAIFHLHNTSGRTMILGLTSL
jgi:hypothetical protein